MNHRLQGKLLHQPYSHMILCSKRMPQGKGLAKVLVQRAPCITLDWDTRQKSRFDATDSTGRQLGVFLPRGTVVRGGEWLAGPGLTVQVLAAEEDLIDVRSNTPLKLLRAAYHLGNRHIPVQVSSDFLRLGWDSVLADMLIGLGLNIERLSASFEPEAGAYAHGA